MQANKLATNKANKNVDKTVYKTKLKNKIIAHGHQANEATGK